MASIYQMIGPWTVAPFATGSSDVSAAVLDKLEWIGAEVPGVVQYDLVRAGQLANPYGGTVDALAAHWVSERDWVYKISFEWAPASSDSRWVLEVDGIDTYADIYVNGSLIGSTKDAYRTYRFPVETSLLLGGTNELVIHIKAHLTMIVDQVDEARKRMSITDGLVGKMGKALIRRYQRSFFSGTSSLLNVGTGVLGIGVYRPVRLVSLPAIHINDVFARTTDITNARAQLTVQVTLDSPKTAADVAVSIELIDPEHPKAVAAAASSTVSVSHGSGTTDIHLEVSEPLLWWPRGYGKPNLYTLRVTASVGNHVVHTHESTIGIRTVELLQKTPSGRETFQLVINGTPVFVHGTNLIPVDYLKVYGSEKDYQRIFALLGAGNNNFLRMWGGGAVESDEFFAQADRTGIMLWQDFYLHSNLYPEYDAEWVKVFRDECADILRRMRTHPCLVMLCGGNEQREGWDEWGWKADPGHFYGERLITEVIPSLLAEMPSGVPYVDNSPHGGSEAQSPAHGDGHIWGSFFNSYKDPLFVTETCWGQESYSHPATLKEVMGLDVDSEEFSKVGWSAAWKKRTGRDIIIRPPFTGGFNFDCLRAYIRSLELEQALADHHALSNFRLQSPSNNGIVYWSFNKGGPLFQFGTVDYRLRPLISYYIVARLFRDVVVGIRRDDTIVRVVASNRSLQTVKAQAHVVHIGTDGTLIKEWKVDVSLPSGPNTRILETEDLYTAVVDRDNELAFVRLSVNGVAVSDEILLFCPMVQVHTVNTAINVAPRLLHDGTYELDLSAKTVSKMVSIVGPDDVLLSDNYFPLIPGFPRSVHLTSISGASIKGSKLLISDIDSRTPSELVL